MQQAEGAKAKGKNIILCFDGTGDWATEHKTNVFLMFERLNRHSQCVFYDGGVGTLSDAKAMTWLNRFWLKLADLAFATGLRDKTLNGYLFLSQNYEPGDTIYLFGFSRGAFTARVLASMVYNFGILRPEHENLAPYLWQTISNVGDIRKFLESAELIRTNFSTGGDVRVHFLGLFDTVSSVGILERFKTYPYTEKNPGVDIVRHAVSISEERNAFPEMLYSLDPNDPRSGTCDVVEVWFPGVHRDVGGGYTINNGMPTEVLNWIIRETEGTVTLDGETKSLDWVGGVVPEVHAQGGKVAQVGSFDVYVLVGLYPMRIWDSSVNGFRFYWPNFNHVRTIPNNGLIHESVEQLRLEPNSRFRPVTLPAEPVYFGPNHPVSPPTAYEVDPACFSFPDLVGITLGTGVSALLAYRLLRGDFGTGAPDHIGWIMLALFSAYIVSLGVWQNFSTRRKGGFKTKANSVLPILGVIAGGILMGIASKWYVAQIALGLGLIVAFLSLMGSGRPALRADRVIPFFALPWLTAGIFLPYVSMGLDRLEFWWAIGAMAIALVLLVWRRQALFRPDRVSPFFALPWLYLAAVYHFLARETSAQFPQLQELEPVVVPLALFGVIAVWGIYRVLSDRATAAAMRPHAP